MLGGIPKFYENVYIIMLVLVNMLINIILISISYLETTKKGKLKIAPHLTRLNMRLFS